jgi:hypothetical protein
MSDEMFSNISAIVRSGLAECVGDILDVGIKMLEPDLPQKNQSEPASER